MKRKHLQVCIFIILLIPLYCWSQIFTEPEDLRKLDIKITKFLKDPTKEGWEDNLKDINIFLGSLKNMILILNGTLPGFTKEFLSKVEEFHRNEKPVFIDTDVVEYELQPIIKVTDEDFTRLYWLRIYAEKDWEMICDILKSKEKLQISKQSSAK